MDGKKGVSNITVTTDDNFGVWFTKDYADKAEAFADFEYTYQMYLADGTISPPTLTQPDQPLETDLTNTSTASCSFVHDRLKLGLFNPSDYVGQGVVFTD